VQRQGFHDERRPHDLCLARRGNAPLGRPARRHHQGLRERRHLHRGRKAKGCELGATSPAIAREAITAPDLCTIYVDDGSGPCAAFVKGCTPGARGGFGHPNGGGLESRIARECFYGEVYLSAGRLAGGVPAAGQILPISQNTALFSLIENRFGGDATQNTFALPDLRGQAPDGLTYVICTQGIYPAQN